MEPTNEEQKKDAPDDDEAALDKEIADSVNKVKAGEVLGVKNPVNPSEVLPTEKKEVPKEEAPKEEAPAEPQADEVKKEEPPEFRIPNKGKFESDESYDKRVELMDLVKRRKAAKTPEQREQLSEQIKATKGQIKNLNGTDKNINPLNEKVEPDLKKSEEDETIKADKERLKQLGGATREDIEEIVRQERVATEVKSTLEKFIDRHAELKDTDTREVFFDFVDQNYNWQNKSGKELMTVLELARESMFKPSETIQERVLKGANVQEKVNAMQFPGGSVQKQAYSPDKKQSIDELKAAGMSEEKALELISED